MDKIDLIIAGVLEREKGYVNHPADRGGATNWGITLATLRAEGAFRDVDLNNDGLVDEQDVRALSKEMAAVILRGRYAEQPRFTDLKNPVLMELAVDASVNHGPASAARMLQRACGVLDDGRVGPMTLAAANAPHMEAKLPVKFLAERVQVYGQIITRDPQLAAARKAGHRTQAENAEGWANRVAGLMKAL